MTIAAACCTVPIGLAGLALLAVRYYRWWRGQSGPRMPDDWEATDGRVLSVSGAAPRRGPLTTGSSVLVSYEYETEGETHHGRDHSPYARLQPSDYQPGDVIEVYYDPDQPAKSTLGETQRLSNSVLVWMGGVLLLFGAVPQVLLAFGVAGEHLFLNTWGLTLFGIAAFFPLRAGVRGLLLSLQSTSWPTTTGEIESSRTADTGSDSLSGFHTQILYVYEVAGKRYWSDTLSFPERMVVYTPFRGRAKETAKKYAPGTRVTVYYHPQYPERAVLEPGSIRNAVYMLVIGLLFGTFFIVWLTTLP